MNGKSLKTGPHFLCFLLQIPICIIMKINESTLITYATSSSCPIDKEGWLWKRGEVNKNFQKRYFVLKGNLLFYFEKRYDKEPIGVIILEGSTIELAEEEVELCGFKIVFHGEGRRIYYLGSESQVRSISIQITVESVVEAALSYKPQNWLFHFTQYCWVFGCFC